MARKSTPHHLTIPLLTSLLRWDGLYMFHCHNLIHEDHDMMAAFNVTALKDLGYDEKTHFIDPMEPQYRAKPSPMQTL
jgi:bilirubin oxidase